MIMTQRHYVFLFMYITLFAEQNLNRTQRFFVTISSSFIYDLADNLIIIFHYNIMLKLRWRDVARAVVYLLVTDVITDVRETRRKTCM